MFLNLSLLTGDFWSVGFSVVAEHIRPLPLFYPSLAFIIGGTILYEMTPSPVVDVHRLIQVHDPDLGESEGNSDRNLGFRPEVELNGHGLSLHEAHVDSVSERTSSPSQANRHRDD